MCSEGGENGIIRVQLKKEEQNSWQRKQYLQKPGVQRKWAGPHRGLFHPLGTTRTALKTESFLKAPNI